MKTRPKKSFEGQQSGSIRRRSKLNRRKALNTVNETIVLSDSDTEKWDRNENDDEDIQVIDIADVSDATLEVNQVSGVVHGLSDFNRDDSTLSSQHTSVVETKPATATNDSNNEPPVIDICDEADDEDDDDGVEVVAVVVSAPRENKNQSFTRKRKSNGNLSVMQDSIRKAKLTVRRNSLSGKNVSPRNRNNSLNGISGASRQINRKNRRNKLRKQRLAAKLKRGKNPLLNRAKEDARQVIYRPEAGGPSWQSIIQRVPQVQNPFTYMKHNAFRDVDPFCPVATSTPAQGNNQDVERTQWMCRRNSPILPGSNIMNVAEAASRAIGTLRPIVIDGSNVAVGHGKMLKTGKFSAKGIQICVDYFTKRGHKEVVVFVPRFRQKKSESMDPELLEQLERDGFVKFTPSREAGAHRIASYDDLFVVQYAHETGGIIVSNDNFRDLYLQNEHWRETIKFRILQYTWITQDCIMFPQDPLGRNGPSLDDFLRY